MCCFGAHGFCLACRDSDGSCLVDFNGKLERRISLGMDNND